MRKSFLRTKYLTGSRIQMRYLGLLMISMVVPMVIVGGCLYYIIFTVMAEQIGIPEYIAQNLFPVIKKINAILFVSVPLLFAALIVWGIALSHRFAGPVERLEEELKRICEKDEYHRRVRLRKRDDIRPVADAINRLLDKVESEKQ